MISIHKSKWAQQNLDLCCVLKLLIVSLFNPLVFYSYMGSLFTCGNQCGINTIQKHTKKINVTPKLPDFGAIYCGFGNSEARPGPLGYRLDGPGLLKAQGPRLTLFHPKANARLNRNMFYLCLKIGLTLAVWMQGRLFFGCSLEEVRHSSEERLNPNFLESIYSPCNRKVRILL